MQTDGNGEESRAFEMRRIGEIHIYILLGMFKYMQNNIMITKHLIHSQDFKIRIMKGE